MQGGSDMLVDAIKPWTILLQGSWKYERNTGYEYNQIIYVFSRIGRQYKTLKYWTTQKGTGIDNIFAIFVKASTEIRKKPWQA